MAVGAAKGIDVRALLEEEAAGGHAAAAAAAPKTCGCWKFKAAEVPANDTLARDMKLLAAAAAPHPEPWRFNPANAFWSLAPKPLSDEEAAGSSC
jgi:hypothetical protein